MAEAAVSARAIDARVLELFWSLASIDAGIREVRARLVCAPRVAFDVFRGVGLSRRKPTTPRTPLRSWSRSVLSRSSNTNTSGAVSAFQRRCTRPGWPHKLRRCCSTLAVVLTAAVSETRRL